jgi:hypothetical protein
MLAVLTLSARGCNLSSQEFWAHHFKPGVHYEPVSYDLRDLVQRSHDLIQEAKADSTR